MTAIRRANAARYLILGLSALLIAVPFYSIVAVALQPQNSPVVGLSWPSHPHWSNFSDAWTLGMFSTLLRNSLRISLLVVVIGTVTSILGGYAFALMRFRGRTVLFVLALIGLALPFEGTILPLYYDLRNLNLSDSYWGVVLPEVGLYAGFGCFWMMTAFKGVPFAVIEAARIDGANSLTILRRVLAPVCRPAVATLMVILFMWSWNEFLVALVILQSPSSQTAPAGLGYFVGQYTTNLPLLAASAVIVALPVVAVYVLLQRQIIRGLTGGAVKG